MSVLIWVLPICFTSFIGLLAWITNCCNYGGGSASNIRGWLYAKRTAVIVHFRPMSNNDAFASLQSADPMESAFMQARYINRAHYASAQPEVVNNIITSCWAKYQAGNHYPQLSKRFCIRSRSNSQP